MIRSVDFGKHSGHLLQSTRFCKKLFIKENPNLNFCEGDIYRGKMRLTEQVNRTCLKLLVMFQFVFLHFIYSCYKWSIYWEGEIMRSFYFPSLYSFNFLSQLISRGYVKPKTKKRKRKKK